MLVIKLWLHIICFVQKIFLKIAYGNKLQMRVLPNGGITFRKNFSVMIANEGIVKIGDNVFFNNDCSINANQEVIIGDGCLFGENVKIYDHNHRFREDKPIKEQGFKNGVVHIGNHCWISSGVIILKDTYIGDDCVIGAGCVISGKVPAGTIVKTDRTLLLECMERGKNYAIDLGNNGSI